jgi:hypothetical protein
MSAVSLRFGASPYQRFEDDDEYEDDGSAKLIDSLRLSVPAMTGFSVQSVFPQDRPSTPGRYYVRCRVHYIGELHRPA